MTRAATEVLPRSRRHMPDTTLPFFPSFWLYGNTDMESLALVRYVVAMAIYSVVNYRTLSCLGECLLRKEITQFQ